MVHKFVKFGSFPGGPHWPTLYRIPVKLTFACQEGCCPWHGTPFKVPSNGHPQATVAVLHCVYDES